MNAAAADAANILYSNCAYIAYHLPLTVRIIRLIHWEYKSFIECAKGQFSQIQFYAFCFSNGQFRFSCHRRWERYACISIYFLFIPIGSFIGYLFLIRIRGQSDSWHVNSVTHTQFKSFHLSVWPNRLCNGRMRLSQRPYWLECMHYAEWLGYWFAYHALPMTLTSIKYQAHRDNECLRAAQSQNKSRLHHLNRSSQNVDNFYPFFFSYGEKKVVDCRFRWMETLIVVTRRRKKTEKIKTKCEWDNIHSNNTELKFLILLCILYYYI